MKLEINIILGRLRINVKSGRYGVRISKNPLHILIGPFLLWVWRPWTEKNYDRKYDPQIRKDESWLIRFMNDVLR